MYFAILATDIYLKETLELNPFCLILKKKKKQFQYGVQTNFIHKNSPGADATNRSCINNT